MNDKEWFEHDLFSGIPNQYVTTYTHNCCNVSLHKHNFFELVIVINGEGYHIVSQERFPLKKGDVFVITPQTEHSFICTKDLTVYHIIISCLFFEHYIKDLEQIPGYFSLFSTEPLFRNSTRIQNYLQLCDSQIETIQKFAFLLGEDSPWNEDNSLSIDSFSTNYFITKNALTLALISYLSRSFVTIHQPSSNTTKKNYYLIIQIIEYINLHYQEKLSIKQLADLCFMSTSNFSKLFKSLTHTTPMRYLEYVRIEKAKQLLKETSLQITDIAQACGFFDTSHFTKSFRNVEKILPKEYRNKEI